MKKRYLVSVLSALTFLLTSCAEFPAATGIFSNRAGAGNQAAPDDPKSATVSFKTVDLTGGDKDLYLVINSRDYRIRRVRAFNSTSRSQYTSHGIPQSAAAAGTFWDSQEEEESQGIYASADGSSVSIYAGYYEPGAMHDVSWTLLRLIKF